MGREVRRVPADWSHPVDSDGAYIPLYEGNDEEIAEAGSSEGSMPVWTEEEATHWMMYSTTSEGTPISPAFATPEALARWLADTGASAFAGSTASYEAWLKVCNGRRAISGVYDPEKGFVSGVEYQGDTKADKS